MAQFINGHQHARQPRLTQAELQQFQGEIRDLLQQLRWEDQDMDLALGYEKSRGQWTRQIIRGRHPSRQYRQRFAVLYEQFQAGQIAPKPPWAPLIVYQPHRNMPRYLTVPLARLTGELRQCTECAAQFAEGRLKDEVDTYWFFGHPRTHICPAHQAAWRRRRDWFRQCQAVGCWHIQDLPTGGHSCAQTRCTQRRRPWRATWPHEDTP
ncbi:MAG: hypothetical protein KKA73_00325 [Chloroflexi bacterium]|nr:hypothetical protein [Chloroflexota bacterium]